MTTEPSGGTLYLLDLFSCRGVGAMGYHRAGFTVVGVDIEPQPLYPFEHHVEDALTFLARQPDLSRFAAIHASPPCQASTTMSNKHRGKGGYTDSLVSLIAPVRESLEASGLPWVMENVAGARAEMRAPITLTGGAFGLHVERPRLFETNWPLTAPAHKPVPRDLILGIYGRSPDGRTLWTRKDGSRLRAARSVEEGAAAMGIDWPIDWRGVTEAIPPVYTEWIGRQLHDHIALEVAA